MSKTLPIVLWTLVLFGFALFLVFRFFPPAPDATLNATFSESPNPPGHHSGDPPGAVLVNVPWKHLPDVPRFDLIDQNGDPFDSQTLVGKPYLVSFFFATCPGICRDLNNQIDRLNQQLRKEDVRFVSLTVDPENDVPSVLKRYAEDYDATADRWVFLTDQKYKISQLGEQVFQVVVDKATHTDSILLVDKWGRYRDRFKWNDPVDMKRLVAVVKDVAVEQAVPLDAVVRTRNVLAGQPPFDLSDLKWVREFHLTDSHNAPFYSRDLTGRVWIANFFFSSCPGICRKQNEYLWNLRERLGEEVPLIVSITTDPKNDTPEVLQQVADSLGADEKWMFCTGESGLIERTSSEFFNAHGSADHHSSRLFVVDRWHQVRGSFDWQDPEEETAMLELIETLELETSPVFPLEQEK